MVKRWQPRGPYMVEAPDSFASYVESQDYDALEAQLAELRKHLESYRCAECGAWHVRKPTVLGTACTCDSTLVTDTSNHQPHCPRYVPETSAQRG